MLLLAGQAHWGGGWWWWWCGHWREWSHDGYSSRFERTPLLPVLKREAHAYISPRQDYSNAPWFYLSAATHFSNCFKTVCFPSQMFRYGHIAPCPLVHLLMFVSDVFWLIWSGVEPYVNRPPHPANFLYWLNSPPSVSTNSDNLRMYLCCFSYTAALQHSFFYHDRLDFRCMCFILVIPWLKALWMPAACCIVLYK